MSDVPKEVELEEVGCPNGCAEGDRFLLSAGDRLHGLPGTFDIWQCRGCELQRTNPRPTADTIGYYYPANYGPYENGSGYIGAKSFILNFLKNILGFDTRRLPDIVIGHMLEVGCSSGGYMEYASEQGWQVEGIEFSPMAADVAREKGFFVEVGSIEGIEKEHAQYDVIVAWMVLEHLHDPILALSKFRNWVAENGYLVISVPDVNAITRKIFAECSYDLHLPNHLFHFNAKTIKSTLRGAGWEVQKIVWQKSCSSLLGSLQYWADERRYVALSRIVAWLRVGAVAKPIRASMGLILGLSRQSGRMEIWAQPMK